MQVNSTQTYNVNKAWIRGFCYFAACWLVGWLSGALAQMSSMPLVTAVQRQSSVWWIWTAVCVVIIGIGYGVIWPRGTLTHGRPLSWTAVLLFGISWGLSEGLLFVSVWFVVSQLTSTLWLVVLITFVILATFIGLWHALYWDIYVAPLHNIEEWNLRKVLFAHTPNLLFTLIYLTLFENMALFVLLQAVALLLSTYFMRFPMMGRTEDG